MLNEFAKEVHKNAVEHGWWEENRSFCEIIALCHSELSEALEEYRNGMAPNYIYCGNKNLTCETLKGMKCRNEICNVYKPEGIPAELADVIIRILDYCAKESIDIDQVIKLKHEYNKTRPYRHGGKVI